VMVALGFQHVKDGDAGGSRCAGSPSYSIEMVRLSGLEHAQLGRALLAIVGSLLTLYGSRCSASVNYGKTRYRTNPEF
jgi:hypothetical protein